MPTDFSQTVNLKERMEKERAARLKGGTVRGQSVAEAASDRPAPPTKTAPARRASNIDRLYRQESGEEAAYDPRTINRPVESRFDERKLRLGIAVAAVIVLVFTVFWLFGRDKTPADNGNAVVAAEGRWYAVKLLNDEIYYGYISDVTADPVVIKNVYYDYDQLNPGPEGEKKEAGSLRLVKRGKEAHGPDGSLDVVRAQVVYMEPLAEDSKVLRAILDYEK